MRIIIIFTDLICIGDIIYGYDLKQEGSFIHPHTYIFINLQLSQEMIPVLTYCCNVKNAHRRLVVIYPHTQSFLFLIFDDFCPLNTKQSPQKTELDPKIPVRLNQK